MRSILIAMMLLAFLAAYVIQLRAAQSVSVTGPVLGEATCTSFSVLVRSLGQGRVVLRVTEAANALTPESLRFVSDAPKPDADFCVHVTATGLKPSTRYRYTVEQGKRLLGDGSCRTLMEPGSPETVRVVFGSCADDRRYPSQGIWNQVDLLDPHAIVLLGDTPYIDSTDLPVQRQRYREFFEVPELKATLAKIPTWCVWDDHDFGKNDSDGRLPGKAASRRAFFEYHAQSTAAVDAEGIYTKFRAGTMEVFVLDTRWFAGMEPAADNPEERSALGRTQWQWLLSELQQSTASWKILASGMIWNGAIRIGKTDHWGHYESERNALFRFVGDNHISGVVLVGGDIHRSRVIRHRTEVSAGYALTEFITSPLANTTMAIANVPIAGLLGDAADPESCLLLTATNYADGARLLGQIINAEGRELLKLELRADEVQGR